MTVEIEVGSVLEPEHDLDFDFDRSFGFGFGFGSAASGSELELVLHVVPVLLPLHLLTGPSWGLPQEIMLVVSCIGPSGLPHGLHLFPEASWSLNLPFLALLLEHGWMRRILASFV